MFFKLLQIVVVISTLSINLSVPAEVQAALLRYDDVIEITTPNNTGTATGKIAVRAGESAVTNLFLTIGELLDSAGNPAVTAEAVTVSPNPIKQLAPNTSLELTLSIDNLPGPGIYTGKIKISYDQHPNGAEPPVTLRLIITRSNGSATSSTASDQSTGLDLAIGTKPDDQDGNISFRIVGSRTSVSIPLFINQRGNKASNIRLFAYLADEDDHQLTDLSFNVMDGDKDVTQSGLTIPASGKLALATLNIANLTATGTFSGNLVAEYQGKVVEIAALKGERLPLPVLEMVGASDEKVNFSTKVSAFKGRLLLESTNASPVEELKIIFECLRDQKGTRIPTHWTVNGQPGEDTMTTVPGLGAAELVITAELPVAGEYNSDITLLYGDQRKSFNLKVTRNRVEPTVEIKDVETILGQADSFIPWGGQDNVNLWLTLHETSGQQATLNLPQFTVLSLKGAEENSYQAQFKGLEVKDEDNNIVQEPLTIEPDEIKRLHLNIRGLSKAGAYVGNLVFTAPGMLAIDSNVTILVRESAWVAGLWIGLSVIVSFLIGLWFKSTRPKLERQRYTNRLLSDLEREAKRIIHVSHGKKKLAEVVDDMSARLEDLYDNPDLGIDANAGEILGEIDKKITMFRRLADAYQQVYTLEPSKLVSRFSPDLDKIQEGMLTRTPASATKVETALKDLFTGIENAIIVELLQLLSGFEKEVRAQINRVSEDNFKEKLQNEILPKITTARDFAEKKPEPEMHAANLEFEEARVLYACAMAEYLRAKLLTPPLGFDRDTWPVPQQAIIDKIDVVVREEDGEQAIAAYHDAYALYLTTLTAKLMERIKEIKESLDHLNSNGINAQMNAEEGNKLKDILEQLLVRLENILTKIKAGDLATARTEYENVQNTYISEVQPVVTKPVVRMNRRSGSHLYTDLAFTGYIPGKICEGLKELSTDRRLRQRKGLGRLITLGDIVVTVVAFFMAIAFGLQVLWSGDATWGGFGDHLIALLWGFGFHQVGNQGVKGVKDILAGWKQE